ncbi:MAG: hypothetical protein M3P27_08570 [Acidobacteriota bacterium]|nr:hypothetical protein [Acidobacteriota bacterium]
MKAIATISTMIMAAGMAAGQATAYKPAAPASQSPAAKTTTTPAAKPAAAAKPAVAASSAKAKPSAGQSTDSAKGRRDPFISPVVVRLGSGGQTACSTGKRCLIIDQLAVEGVVCSRLDMRSQVRAGQPHKCLEWIAVVGNPAKKIYYVRENDALYDGYVARITSDSVVFRQNVVDSLGKSVQKEVVKRIAPSA